MQPMSPPEAVFAPFAMFGFMCCGGLVGVLGFVFWIWMLIDCATNEPNEGNDKVVWIIIIALLNWLGALLYFFIRRPNRPPPGGV